MGGSDTHAALTWEEGLNGLSFIGAKAAFEAFAAWGTLPDSVVDAARAAAGPFHGTASVKEIRRFRAIRGAANVRKARTSGRR